MLSKSRMEPVVQYLTADGSGYETQKKTAETL